MMWRNSPGSELALSLSGVTRFTRRPQDRQRLRLVNGLRRVSRRASTNALARRYEVLLCERAASVRSDLLAVAATLERVADPEPDTLRTLRWLLTDGCTSPLYNADVPAAGLNAVLCRLQAELDSHDRSALSAPAVLPLQARHVRGTRKGVPTETG